MTARPGQFARFLDFEGPRGNWRNEAACKGMDPNLFFADDEGFTRDATLAAEAKAVCERCPVLDACRAFAWTDHYGIYGGMSGDERRLARRRARRVKAS